MVKGSFMETTAVSVFSASDATDAERSKCKHQELLFHLSFRGETWGGII